MGYMIFLISYRTNTTLQKRSIKSTLPTVHPYPEVNAYYADINAYDINECPMERDTGVLRSTTPLKRMRAPNTFSQAKMEAFDQKMSELQAEIAKRSMLYGNLKAEKARHSTFKDTSSGTESIHWSTSDSSSEGEDTGLLSVDLIDLFCNVVLVR